ncbi:ATP-dependent helicase C-terminal domain-containing protein, partial [Mesorhizobium sp.]
DAALDDSLDDWLLPYLSGAASFAAIDPSVLSAGLMALVPHDLQRRIEALAPTHFDAPSGSRVPIRYDGEWPVLAIRVQELFGLDRHPAIASGTVPLTLELLSPAHRPIQTTRDLPGFWRGSWADVRADMRGRYPKHVWPENPLLATATSRAKPRGT